MFALLGGQTIWLVYLVLAWVAVPVACNFQAPWILHLLSAGAAALVSAALATGIVAARRLPADTDSSRPAFMARVGAGLDALALFLVLLMWLLLFFLHPCDGNREFPLWLF